MPTIERFEDVGAWKLAREAALMVYEISSQGDFGNDITLRNEMRRATIAIVSSIAEGFERNDDKQFLKYLTMARSLCGKARAQLYLALDQNYVDETQFTLISNKLVETSRAIAGFIKYLEQSEPRIKRLR